MLPWNLHFEYQSETLCRFWTWRRDYFLHLAWKTLGYGCNCWTVCHGALQGPNPAVVISLGCSLSSGMVKADTMPNHWLVNNIPYLSSPDAKINSWHLMVLPQDNFQPCLWWQKTHIFLMRCLDTSSHVCADKTWCFDQTSGHLPPCLWWPNEAF